MTQNSTPPPDNPIAVALQHNPNSGRLPTIVASGRGVLAEQILEIAFAHGVKVREDASLAEILSALDLDTDIPSEAIVAVGEILARLYEANAALAAGALAETHGDALTRTLAGAFPNATLHPESGQ